MEWKLIASIASFAVVGVSVAASVLLDREGSAAGPRHCRTADLRVGEEAVIELEEACQEEYDQVVCLGGGARAVAPHGSNGGGVDVVESRQTTDRTTSTGKGYTGRIFVGRASSRW